jgi:hypothetical protein
LLLELINYSSRVGASRTLELINYSSRSSRVRATARTLIWQRVTPMRLTFVLAVALLKTKSSKSLKVKAKTSGRSLLKVKVFSFAKLQRSLSKLERLRQ